MARWKNSPAVYEAADLFRQRCLIDQTSLLWPGNSAWTPSNIDALWEAFIGRPDEGKRSFFEKWRDQLADQPPDIHRIAADVTAFYYLFPSNVGAAAKLDGVREVISWKLAEDRDPPELAHLTAAFDEGVGHSGIYYLTGRPWQIAYYLQFARRLINDGVDPHDPVACQLLADEVRAGLQGTIAARHVLLHLLFPDRYERIASEGHKRQLIARFRAEADGATDVDEALFAIRRALTSRFGRPDIDFYEDDILELWSEPAQPPPPPNGGGGAPGLTPSTLDGLIAATHIDRRELEEIRELLEEKRQLVFEGPPGSGKTYVAELFARWFVEAPLGSLPDERVELIQFHQSYGYEDFVQGIRPETDAEGRLHYRVRDGIFKRLCSLAAVHPDRRFVLVVDEINRGNVARIFGELLLLLEYRDKRARLPYATGDEGDDAYLTLPENLYLIGTMNSTDRSLSQIDYALRRRFYYRRFLPVENGKAPVLEGWLRAKGVPVESRQKLLALFIALNRRIEELLTPDYQIGHSYFMVPDIDTEAGLDRVWRRAIRPLLEEYFHNHRDREVLLRDLHPDRLLSNESVVEAAEDDAGLSS